MSDKPYVYEDNGRIIYRASALGGSIHCLVAARLGYEPIAPPASVQVHYDAGHTAEPIALDALRRDDGWHIYDQQKEVALKVTEKIWVVGHIDGKGVRDNGEARIVEVKSQSQKEYDAFDNNWTAGLWLRYAWQTSVYQIAEGLGLLLVRINRETSELSVDFLDTPRHSLTDIRHRILGVEAQAAKGELPTEHYCTDYPCPFFYTHTDAERVVLEDPQIELLAKEYKSAQTDEKAAKGRKRAAFTALRNTVGDERKLLTENGWKVTFYDKRNPFKQLQTDTPLSTLASSLALAVVEQYKVPTFSEQVRITPPPEEAAHAES